MGLEETRTAHTACEAGVLAHMGTLVEQNCAKRRTMDSMRYELPRLFAFLPVLWEWEEVFVDS